MLKGRNLIAPNDFTVEELLEVLELAGDVFRNPQNYLDVCKGKLLASLFYEPSTRTKNSFDSAMLRLGGQVIGCLLYTSALSWLTLWKEAVVTA